MPESKNTKFLFVGFFTNGLLLNENAAKEIISAGIYRVLISIDGATKATYESVRRGALFEKLIANINMLNRQKALNHTRMPLLGFNFVIMRRNVAEMPILVELASSLDVDFVDFTPLIPLPCLEIEDEVLRGEEYTELYNSSFDRALEIANCKGIKIFAPPKFAAAARTNIPMCRTLRKYLNSVAEYTGTIWPMIERQSAQLKHRIFGGKFNAEKYVLCRTPWEIFEVSFNGDVHTCFCNRRGLVGNLLEQTFDEIWEGEQFQSLRRSLSGLSRIDTTCKKCPDRSSNMLSSNVFHEGIFGVDFWGSPQTLRQ